MNELKRPRVVGGKIRTVTNAQHGRILELTVEQAHDSALAVFVERGCGFVEKDPARFVQEEPREGEALLLAERKLIVPALNPVELGDEIAEIAALEGLSHIRIRESVGGARITQGVAQCPERQIGALRQECHRPGCRREDCPGTPRPETRDGTEPVSYTHLTLPTNREV